MKKIKIGVMPAAGIGRRLTDLPLTRILPKPLLPILNKPIMEYGIENMKKMGVETVYIIVGPKIKLIKEYFGDGNEFGVQIKYLLQPTISGLANAIYLTKPYVDEPFCVILGDDFTLADSLDNLVDEFWSKGAKIIEGVVDEQDIKKIKIACSVDLGKNNEIIEITEKPNIVTSKIRGCGIYICHPIVYDYINRTQVTPYSKEKDITNTIKLMAKERIAYGSFINGININVNMLDDLLEAMQLMVYKKGFFNSKIK